MAEGWAKNLKGEKYTFYSAGTKKHGLNPRAVQVMSEVGVDISRHTSNTTDEIVEKMEKLLMEIREESSKKSNKEDLSPEETKKVEEELRKLGYI